MALIASYSFSRSGAEYDDDHYRICNAGGGAVFEPMFYRQVVGAGLYLLCQLQPLCWTCIFDRRTHKTWINTVLTYPHLEDRRTDALVVLGRCLDSAEV